MGATSGIGKDVALLLSEKGWQIGIAGRREDLLKEISKSATNIIATKCIDVTQDNAPTLLRSLIDEMGGIDLYFHSSGIGYQNVSLEQEKEIATTMTNSVGFTRMVTTAFNYFAEKSSKITDSAEKCSKIKDSNESSVPKQENNGHTSLKPYCHIAVISSIAGTKGLGAAPAYSATKRFQNHYMECLSQLIHIRKLNIHLTDIRPGFVATDLLKDDKYPMQLTTLSVAKDIVKAIEKKRSIVTIDWKYKILVFFWKLIPRWLWIRLPIKS